MLLLDAFNIIHATGVLPPEHADIDVPGLVALLVRSRYARTPTTLVCDGPRPGVGHAGPSASAIAGTRILYTGAGREADDEIERLLEASSFASRMLVVSSDKRVQRAARRRGARWTRSSTFLHHVALDLARPARDPLPKWVHEIPLGPAEVEQWMRQFGLPEDWGPRAERRPPAPSPPSNPPARDPPASGARVEPEPPAGPPIRLDEATRRLIEEHAIDPDELDMGRWMA